MWESGGPNRSRGLARAGAAAIMVVCAYAALEGAAMAHADDVAPALRVSDGTISWSANTGAAGYKGAMSTAPVGSSDRTTTYKDLGSVTSWTPPQPGPGQTLYYSVTPEGPAGDRWASEVSITTPRTTNNAPVLSLSNGKISWPAQPGASSYEVAIVSNPTTTRDTTYQIVNGTSWTPPAVPGQTLNYSVRSNVVGSQWAAVVTISWPAQMIPTTTTTTTTTTTSTATTSPPPTAPVQDTGKLKVGVMNIGNYNYSPLNSAQVFSKAGITYTREDVGGGANTGTCNSSDYVCTALRYGVTPIVLFEGYADSNMTSEIVSLAQRLEKLSQSYPIMNKMHVIEFGNEVWAGTSGAAENAATYGAQYNSAHAALAAAGLGDWKLLAVGNGLGTCVNSYTSPNWINQVIAAQSLGAAGVDGWTVHPYGPMTTDYGCGAAGRGYGWPEVLDYHDIAVKAGSTAPWYVTEVGQCLGGAGCNAGIPMGAATDMPGSAGSPPYFTQAADMRQYLTDAGGDVRTGAAAKYPWIAALIWYQAYDDGSGWFGILSNGSNLRQPVNYQRLAFTVLTQWLAANGEG